MDRTRPSPPDEGTENMLLLRNVPVHAVARDGGGNPLPVRRGPGRPRKVRTAPTADQTSYDAIVRAARDAHVGADAVVRASELRDGSRELGWAILQALARETAALAWEIEQRPSSREAERARTRRIDGLLAVAKLRAEIHRAEAGELTPRRVALLQGMLLDALLEVARATLPTEKVDALEDQVRAAWSRLL